MQPIKKDQIKTIYSLCASLGIVERDNKEDDLHILVAGVTGKDNVSELMEDEAKKVIAELRFRLQLGGREPPPTKSNKKHTTRPGGISAQQQKMIWAMMYQLKSYDTEPIAASLGERLAGIIRRHLHIDATEKDPFAWLKVSDAQRLIHIIEQYVDGAKKKRMGGVASG